MLWHCWFGHLACKNCRGNNLLCVEWDSLTSAVDDAHLLQLECLNAGDISECKEDECEWLKYETLFKWVTRVLHNQHISFIYGYCISCIYSGLLFVGVIHINGNSNGNGRLSMTCVSLRYFCGGVTLLAGGTIQGTGLLCHTFGMFCQLGQFFFCISFVFLVYVVLCLIVFGCQYRCSWLPGKTRLRNDLLCVEWDVKPYTLTLPYNYLHTISHAISHLVSPLFSPFSASAF